MEKTHFKSSNLLYRTIVGTMAIVPATMHAAKGKAKVPNIIYIMADDLGYGDLGCYGQPYIETPNIDRMASEGMRFTQAYAGSPVSAPSRATLMTGQHTGHTLIRGNKGYSRDSKPIVYGKNQDWSVVGQHPYDPGHKILPEIMKENGYRTSMFGKWAAGYEGSVSMPETRGVDEYFGYICQSTAHLYYPNFLNEFSRAKGDTATHRVVLEDNIQWPMFGNGYEKRTQYSADLIHRRALEWIDKQDANHPFISLLTYTLPHAELVQPNDSLLNYYKQKFHEDKTWGGDENSRYNATVNTHAQFAAMISRLDAYVGEIVAKLKEKGLDENTVIIFTSDNGPHEEGGADPTFFGRDGKLKGLKRQCYEGGIRIPFIIKWPGHIQAGTTTDQMIAFYDILPTFCEMAGIKNFAKHYTNNKLEGDGFDGISFLPTLMGKEQKEQHPYLYWEFSETDQFGVREGDWKLVVIKGKPHLYNLANDIHEDHDLASKHPEIVTRMIDYIKKEHRESDLFPITMPRFVGDTPQGEYGKYYTNLDTNIDPIKPFAIPDNKVNLKDYGVSGDGNTLVTESIEKAISDLSAKGGGTLTIPRGVWLTGPILLKDNIELHLEKNAILYFSPDKELYIDREHPDADRVKACVYAYKSKNISITGQGIIDGNGKQWRYMKRSNASDIEWKEIHEMGGVELNDGKAWYPWKMKSGYADIATDPEKQEHLRNDLVRFDECENILVKGITIQNPPRFHLHPRYSANIIIDGVTVRAPWNAHNSDGIDLTDCHKALIVNNTVDVGDDGICLKSERPIPGRLSGCQDFVIENNTVYNAHGGFVLGSVTAGGMRDIIVRNNSYVGTEVGLRFKSGPDRGGHTERIYISDITMTDIKNAAIVFQCDYKNRIGNKLNEQLASEYGQWMPDFQDIHIKRVNCRGAKTAIIANGVPNHNCVHNIDIRKSTFVYTDEPTQIDPATTDINLKDLVIVKDQKK